MSKHMFNQMMQTDPDAVIEEALQSAPENEKMTEKWIEWHLLDAASENLLYRARNKNEAYTGARALANTPPHKPVAVVKKVCTVETIYRPERSDDG